MQEGGDVRAHTSEMERIREELSGLGALVNDSDFGAHLTTDAEYQDTLNQNTSRNSALSASTGRKRPKRGGKTEEGECCGE